MPIKLPKQWRHWCRLSNLRPEGGNTRRDSAWMSLNGRGRKWRITLRDVRNPYDCIFQAGDRYEDFSRWALSNRMDFEIPQTYEEFSLVISRLEAVGMAG